MPTDTATATDKAEEKTSAPMGERDALDVSDLTDSDACTVLYNYGVVAADAKQFLGGDNGLVTFTGGVAREVPFRTARLWRDGKRIVVNPVDQSERLEPVRGAPKVYILRRTATEADYLRATNPDAAASDPASPARVAANLRAMSPEKIIKTLGAENARLLVEALAESLGLRVSSAFAAEKVPAGRRR